ncbi:hypothetical protein L6164_025382 [Bauhinia variegata]|nr:hypothetical protein L6164_025382 [Bauhinia variegata]
MTRKNINAESYTLHLSAQEDTGAEKECSYYMWRQKFPVRPENIVERRMDVEEWVITLAFPNRERLHRGSTLPGVYAFLPTEMVTNFPFIIQADFVLASSRETILLDNKWNQGILDCIPFAFLDAFKTLVLETQDAPVSSLPPMFKFLPIDKCSSYQKLNAVREKIKAKVVEENIVPIQTYKKQKHFYKPCEVGRLLPDFWDILTSAEKQGVSLFNISSHGRYILNSSFDRNEYDDILNFLGVEPVNSEWYVKCIKSSQLVEQVSEDVYLELLLFIAENWGSRFCGSGMKTIPLIKYVTSYGCVSRCSMNECTQGWSVHLADQSHSCPISWLIDWNREFHCLSNHFFIPELTQKSIQCLSKKWTLIDWLQNRVNVTSLNVSKFAKLLCGSLQNDSRLVIAYAHFLYLSFAKNYLLEWELDDLIGSMPLVDNHGQVTRCRSGILLPANNSKWAELMVSNPWRGQGYVELGEEYLRSNIYAGQLTANQQLLGFLKTRVGASDIPHLCPPNAGFSAVETPLTKENAFLLLDWIRYLKQSGVPERFLCSIKEGKWLKVTVNGWRPPSKTFFLDSSLGNILQSGSVLVDIPLVDLRFYGNRLNEYKEELKTVGVMFHYEEACKFIGKELMSLAASFSLSKGHVILMLHFMRYLRKNYLPLEQFVNSIKEGTWLRTSKGYRSPVGSVLYDSGWQTASQISDIPFIEQPYYGEQIYYYKEELQLLGVIIGFNQNYKLVADHLKSPSCLVSLTAEALLLILECISHLDDSGNLVNALKQTKCLKTNLGFHVPGECFLFDPVWGCILEVFNGFPLIDSKFYGAKIFSHKAQLKQIGVVVDFEEAMKAFAHVFKQKASQASFNKQQVLSFLSCRRQLKAARYKFPIESKKTIRESKWLRTRGGNHMVPSKCILFGPEWEYISPIAHLPFIDDSDSGYGKGIHKYKEELKKVGVVIELKDGVKSVAAGLSFPKYASSITPENVFSLLECVRLLVTPHNLSLEDDFKEKLSRNWLKTNTGYVAPNKCLLFDSKWRGFLNPMDGPFIDENFYGPKIASYRKELTAIGVTVDVDKGCSIVASHLELHSEHSTIARIYRYLYDHNWIPETEAGKRIWIPNGNGNGEWVNPEDCVIHDEDNLFGSRFYILEKHYDKKLLPFFSSLSVKHKPSIDDYIELWEEWESLEKISHDECCKFWAFVLQHWSQKTEKKLADRLMKLPVPSGPNEILLLNKDDVFIADNLSLKTLFEDENVFIWYPQQSLPSLPRSELLDIYRKIGVRNISESVSKEETSLLVGFQLRRLDPRDSVIGKGLVKLILGFLACSILKMEAEKRHEAVQGLIGLAVLETPEPVTVRYSLELSYGNIISKEASRMVRWERENMKFFSHKRGFTGGSKSMIKYATYFSEAISEGVLNENVEHVPALSELIKLAFVLEFEEESVDFLMESKDLQIFLEDEEFLGSAFPSD